MASTAQPTSTGDKSDNEKLAALLDPANLIAMYMEGVKPGQLWLAEPYRTTHDSGSNEQPSRYLGSSEFVLVTAIDEADPRLVHVVPMSNDPSLQTERSVVVADSPMGMPMVAWKQLAAVIPVRFLSRPLGSFDEETAGLLAQGEPNEQLGITRGARPLSQIGRENRGLTFRAIRFVVWQAACGELPQLDQEEERKRAAAAAEHRAAYLEALKTVFGMQSTDRLRVMRGVKKLTAAQQKKMANAGFPNPPAEDTADALPVQYQVMAEQPMWRPLVEQSGKPEDETRAQLAKQAFMLAARTTGPQDSAIFARFEQAARRMLAKDE